jgi:hypothetical protein
MTTRSILQLKMGSYDGMMQFIGVFKANRHTGHHIPIAYLLFL